MSAETEPGKSPSEEELFPVPLSSIFEPVEQRPRYERKYVYCIIPFNGAQLSLGSIGIGGADVYTINHGSVAAVVSDSPAEEYALTEENISAHNEVISQVMKNHPVVPMAFGMVFKNEKTLGAVMGRAREEIKKALKTVEGKVELGVKVILPKGAELDQNVFASEIKQLQEIASQSKLGRRFSERLILNAFYLVPNDKVDAFSEAVEKLQEKFSQLKIQYSGPWPPYNFTTMKIGRE